MPSLKLQDESLNIKDKAVMGKVLFNGLTSIDVYIPSHDLIIEFDGPKHFFQDRDTSEVKVDTNKIASNPKEAKEKEFVETAQFVDLIKDLEPYQTPRSRLLQDLKRSQAKKFIAFDF